MGPVLRLVIVEDGAEPERLVGLTSRLRDELARLDVADVELERLNSVPAGSRTQPAAVAGLLVTLGGSADGLRAVVVMLRQWIEREDCAPCTVRVEIGADALELSSGGAADQDRRTDTFLEKLTN
ncbi:MAG: hypothetical protein ABW046_04385 [Actinoplanes sp.]